MIIHVRELYFHLKQFQFYLSTLDYNECRNKCTFISKNNRATGNLISTRNDFSKLNIESFVEFLPNCYICLLGKRISKKVVIYSCQTALFVPETILFPCSSLFERNQMIDGFAQMKLSQSHQNSPNMKLFLCNFCFSPRNR